jgi:hypothetical protein
MSSSSPSGSAMTQGASAPQGSAPAQSASAGGATPAASSIASTVTINWTPPTENVDGTTLTNLAGYNIHYGTASHRYTQTISITNPGIATYVVESLTPGTYYFAVAAVNSTGAESPLSAEVSATVN